MLGTPGLNPAQLNYIDIQGTGNKVTEAFAVAVSCCKFIVALGRRVALELPWATVYHLLRKSDKEQTNATVSTSYKRKEGAGVSAL